ncbi:MAG: lipopolysaccharide export system permease protein [Verrucomicrobia bacterium]|nr:MAG: lipopolysaccharide export system permease protein [Verrucomicrobiota bacterium]
MTLLDRYIFRSVLFTCLAAVGLFAFIVLVPNIARDLLAYVLAGQLSTAAFGRLMLLLVPLAITYALPMGLLTGVLLTLGRLSADHEITAMRAAGLSLPRLTVPVLFLAVIGAGVGLYFNFDSMPRARVEYHRELADAVRTNSLSFIEEKTFIRTFPGYVVYVNEKAGAELKDFWLWELDDQKRVARLVRAAAGHLEYDGAENALILTLTHAQVETRNDKNPENFADTSPIVSFEKSEPVRLSLNRFFKPGSVRVKPDWMTFSQLRTERVRLAARVVPPGQAKDYAREAMKLELVYQDKFNTALAVFSLALIGVPLGLKVSRRETSANFGVALLLTLGYYLLTVAVKALDRHPEYRPDLLIWVPNLLIIGIGVWLFTRIEKK